MASLMVRWLQLSCGPAGQPGCAFPVSLEGACPVSFLCPAPSTVQASVALVEALLRSVHLQPAAAPPQEVGWWQAPPIGAAPMGTASWRHCLAWHRPFGGTFCRRACPWQPPPMVCLARCTCLVGPTPNSRQSCPSSLVAGDTSVNLDPSYAPYASGGGGTGLLGRGADGTPGSTDNIPAGGGGGSGGIDGVGGDCSTTAVCGGAYGGGGGRGKGAGGACRIMWGPGRAYPATNTQDQ